MPGISYSTGSSMVRILRVVSLRIDSMVASVVVLPLPVGPVMTIMPCGSASRWRNVLSSWLDRPSLLNSRSPRSRGRSRTAALSPCCVGMVATRTSISERPTRRRAAPSCGKRRSAMLSPARIFMRDTSACGMTPGGAGMARNMPSTRMRTVSPLRNGSMWMSLARNSTARSIRSLNARTTAVETLEDGGDVLERGDHQFDRVAEHDLGGADRRRIHGIGHRKFNGTAGRPEREHHGFPQEAPGKTLDLGLGRQQFEQADALQIEEPGHLIGEFGGRQVGGFPQFPQGLDGRRAGLAGAGRAAGGQGIFLEKVSAKFLG